MTEVIEKAERDDAKIEAVLSQNRRANIRTITAKLFKEEPFFASILRRIAKKENPNIPTACVYFDKKRLRFVMEYNPEFMIALGEKGIRGVIKHEIYHIAFEHVTNRLPAGVNPRLWNIATDAAINSIIIDEIPKVLPSGGHAIVPGYGPFSSYPPEKSAEWYMSAIMGDPRLNQVGEKIVIKLKAGSKTGDKTLDDILKELPPGTEIEVEIDSSDDHDKWGEGDGDGDEGEGKGEGASADADAKIASQKARELIEKAVRDAKKANSWGSVPQSMRGELEKIAEASLPWRQLLSYFIASTVKVARRKTHHRINRRTPYIFPGRKKDRMARILVAIDESGSVGNDMLARMFAELQKLGSIATFDVVPFDTEVVEEELFTWTKGMKVEPFRTRCGGTCFNAPTKFADEKKYDGLIIMTDLCAAEPDRCRARRMWITNKSCFDNYKDRYLPNVNEIFGVME